MAKDDCNVMGTFKEDNQDRWVNRIMARERLGHIFSFFLFSDRMSKYAIYESDWTKIFKGIKDVMLKEAFPSKGSIDRSIECFEKNYQLP